MTSVLANFICDVCVGDDVLAAANREITLHIETLHKYSLANPGVGVVVVPPLPRADPDWFPAYLPCFTAFLYHEVARIGNPQLKYLSPFVAPPSFYESDRVHLNADAGHSFIHFLVSGVDLLFPSNVVSQPQVSDAATPTGGSSEVIPGTVGSSSMLELRRDVSDLRSEVRRRRLQDNLLFARIKEDRDHEINKSREDRCTISGLNVTVAPPSDPKERKEFFKGLITGLVTEAFPDVERPPLVLDVLVNMRYGRGPPFFEVKFDSPGSSSSFRISAAKLAKSETGSFKGLFISNNVNLSTRIRIDIMKLIAKRLSSLTEYSYVQGFSSRPTLHYKMKEAEEGAPTPVAALGTGRSYTFVESVERWGHLLKASALDAVRRKASTAFSGCLEQYFVVLSDLPPEQELEADLFTRLANSGPSSRSSYPYRGGSGRRPHQPRRGGRGGRGGRILTGAAEGGSLLTGGNAWGVSESASSSTPTKRIRTCDSDEDGPLKKK